MPDSVNGEKELVTNLVTECQYCRIISTRVFSVWKESEHTIVVHHHSERSHPGKLACIDCKRRNRLTILCISPRTTACSRAIMPGKADANMAAIYVFPEDNLKARRD
jgi:hypothetical protein